MYLQKTDLKLHFRTAMNNMLWKHPSIPLIHNGGMNYCQSKLQKTVCCGGNPNKLKFSAQNPVSRV